MQVLLTASLLLALTINPIGAVIHGWQHLAQLSADHGKSLHPGGHVCELCAAYAALEHASLGIPLSPQPVTPASPGSFLAECNPPASQLFHYHQRAPPAAFA